MLACLGASLAVGKLSNICWLDRPGYQTGSIKDIRLSYGSLLFRRIYRIGWPEWCRWSLQTQYTLVENKFVKLFIWTHGKYNINTTWLNFDRNTQTKTGLVLQGTESSDLSLISDFFPTPRTILEISGNQKRKFFRGWGYRYWGKMTQKSIGMHYLRPSNPKIFWGRTPRPPTWNHIHLSSFNDSLAFPIKFGITHFSDFFAKTHSDPCFSVCVPVKI